MATRGVLYGKIDNAGSSGDLTLVAAVAGLRIIVLNYVIFAGGTTTAGFYDGPSTNNLELTGPYPLTVSSGVSSGVAPLNEWRQGHFETSIGNALVLNIGSAIQVSGHFSYIKDNL